MIIGENVRSAPARLGKYLTQGIAPLSVKEKGEKETRKSDVIHRETTFVVAWTSVPIPPSNYWSA